MLTYLIIAVLLGNNSMTVRALVPDGIMQVDEASAALRESVADREIMAVVYLSDYYEVKETPSREGETVLEVPSGQTVFIQDVCLSKQNEVWMQIVLDYEGQEYEGYISRNNLACSDERFLAWEREYNLAIPINYAADAQRVSADIAQFPVSYQPALTALKAIHPNWVFVPMNTGLDWNSVIANELTGGKSLVHKSFPDHLKNGAYDDGNWFYATEGVLKLYMDPRNSLTEDAIFQFEQLTYNATYHTEEALERFLQNTFMNSNQKAPGTVMTYAHIIWAVGAEATRQVSPFHLASRIYQEQGNGNSALISGTYPGYVGLYNYFNVGASGTTATEVIVNGLTYARNANPQWNNAYYSILGGADVISANYIRKGQDTLYLQKYNVNPSGSYPLYTHQYMQNIAAPTSEAKTIRNLYKNAGALESPFVFKIPVYNNMPAEACPMPVAEQFSDVNKSSWQYPYVKYVVDNGLMAGKGKTANGSIIFEPNANMTREQFVQVLYSREGKPAAAYSGKFADVPQGKWYTDAIMWATENGIVAGRGEVFGVDAPITREEMVVMLHQYFRYKGPELEGISNIRIYKDSFQVSDWAVRSMQWAVYYKIIAGQGDLLAPKAYATRAEAATMIKAFIESCG